MDRTLILVKPDAFARHLTGEIIARFERKGLQLAALKMMSVDEDTAKHHYAEHDGKPFFDALVDVHHVGPDRRDDPRGAATPSTPHASSSARRTASRPRRARSAATTRSRCAATSSTARTRPSPPRARSPSSSAADPPARCAWRPGRLVLASRSPQRRAILEQLRHRVRGAGDRRRGDRGRRPRRGRARQRAAQGASRRRAAPRRDDPRRRHRRRARRRDLRQAALPGGRSRRR